MSTERSITKTVPSPPLRGRGQREGDEGRGAPKPWIIETKEITLYTSQSGFARHVQRFLVAGLIFSWPIVGSNGAVQERAPDLPVDTLPASWNWLEPPLGISKFPNEPLENPSTELKIRLGRRLFFDSILSDDESMSCASCHRPDHGFASPQTVSIGVGGKRGERNVPTILNRALGEHFFWDGRATSLEEQALQPIANPLELASSTEAVLRRLQADPSYQEQFRIAFIESSPGDKQADQAPINAMNLANAIACFERTLIVGNSPADQFRAARYDALTLPQRTGMWIFESRGQCWQCHSGDNFSDDKFHNTGVSFGTKNRDVGRYKVTKQESDRFAMKTPTLRGIAQTSPYMHDGSMATLREVVEFYNRGGSPKDLTLDKQVRPLNLTESEINALTEFLEALSPRDPFAR